MATVQFEAQGYAVPPALWPDPDEAGQEELRNAVQYYLGGVGVGMENLEGEQDEEEEKERVVTFQSGVGASVPYLSL